MENFEEDCKNIISQLNKIFEENNCSKRIKYQDIKVNMNFYKENDEIITEENKKLIYKMFLKDFEYFNYEK